MTVFIFKNLLRSSLCLIFLLSFVFQNRALADEEVTTARTHLFEPRLISEPQRPRSIFLPQLISFVLPGYDQWYEGQYASAGFYTASAITGMTIFEANRDRDDQGESLGAQLLMASGSLSAYESFRSAVRSQKPSGRFSFLTEEEQTNDLMKAPFHFSYLGRVRVLIPIGVAAAIAGLALSSDKGGESRSFTGGDAMFSGATSYMAGVNEEALFRGWLMPVAMDQLNSPFWSNFTTSTLFALAHLGTVKLPIAQFFMGMYLADTDQKNNWTLSEGVFIHAWWDMILLSADYIQKAKHDPDRAVLRTPTFTFSF